LFFVFYWEDYWLISASKAYFQPSWTAITLVNTDTHFRQPKKKPKINKGKRER
jgi:hypothetical protein